MKKIFRHLSILAILGILTVSFQNCAPRTEFASVASTEEAEEVLDTEHPSAVSEDPVVVSPSPAPILEQTPVAIKPGCPSDMACVFNYSFYTSDGLSTNLTPGVCLFTNGTQVRIYSYLKVYQDLKDGNTSSSELGFQWVTLPYDKTAPLALESSSTATVHASLADPSKCGHAE